MFSNRMYRHEPLRLTSYQELAELKVWLPKLAQALWSLDAFKSNVSSMKVLLVNRRSWFKTLEVPKSTSNHAFVGLENVDQDVYSSPSMAFSGG